MGCDAAFPIACSCAANPTGLAGAGRLDPRLRGYGATEPRECRQVSGAGPREGHRSVFGLTHFPSAGVLRSPLEGLEQRRPLARRCGWWEQSGCVVAHQPKNSVPATPSGRRTLGETGRPRPRTRCVRFGRPSGPRRTQKGQIPGVDASGVQFATARSGTPLVEGSGGGYATRSGASHRGQESRQVAPQRAVE